MLEEERRVYDQRLPGWLAQQSDTFVLIKGSEVVGFYDSDLAALAEGGRRFGLASFLLRRVETHQQEVVIPPLTLGMLHADSQRSTRGTGAGT